MLLNLVMEPKRNFETDQITIETKQLLNWEPFMIQLGSCCFYPRRFPFNSRRYLGINKGEKHIKKTEKHHFELSTCLMHVSIKKRVISRSLGGLTVIQTKLA
ncbi:hypothetical protein CDAR_449771 [Caerostris darwini]|uniref:Uncharacterized protein n=1 Tax=Caerostris darwini TaxID=1538125 RepID=A0AAV4QVB9_9ARAC|nr:hypothetical protein CDAR_449771 [Caerostris darwini]